MVYLGHSRGLLDVELVSGSCVLELDAPAVWPSEPLAGNPASGGESSCHHVAPLAVIRRDRLFTHEYS